MFVVLISSMGKSPHKSQEIPPPFPHLPLIDCHSHFPLIPPPKKIPEPYEDQYTHFLAENGQYIINSCQLDDTYQQITDFQREHPQIRNMIGWGPQTVTYASIEYQDHWFPRYLDFLVQNPREYVAIGEIGLDFHHVKSREQRERQIKIFSSIITHTKHLQKPYCLHIRNAGREDQDTQNLNDPFNAPDAVNQILLDLLTQEKIPPERVMWHCFSGPASWGFQLAQKGYYLSVPSSAWGFEKWRNIIDQVPLQQLLTETDSMWQHPSQIGKFNQPVNVKFSIAAIASVVGMDQFIVAKQVVQNATKFFRLPQSDKSL